MKIIFIDPIGQMLGYYDYRICLSLAQRGHQVRLVSTDNSYSHRQGETPFQIHTLFSRTDETAGKLRKGLSYLISLWRLLRLLGKDGPQIVCFQYNLFPLADLLFIFLCRARGHKVVFFAHDILPLNCKAYHKYIYATVYRAVDKVLVFAQASKDLIVGNLNVDVQKVSLKSLGNFLYLEQGSWTRESARESLGIDERAKVILFFGQIKKSKGLEHLIRALPEVILKEPDALLVIAGRPLGVELSLYTELIKEHSLEERVILDTRYIPDEEVSKYFECTDLIALPYTEVYQSAVLMLACSHGTPVVASSLGGISEVITDGSTGYLVPPGDEKELAAAIVKALQNPGVSHRMGEKAQRLMKERFSFEQQYVEDLEEILTQV